MSKRGRVFVCNIFAGELEERDEGGFIFSYDQDYLLSKTPRAVSLTMPLRSEPYHSSTLFPFFDGLIPEGWLLNITTQNWKIDARDRMELLLRVCGDCVGTVHIEAAKEEKHS
jgi:serine/threonine-protein kinase HipA